MRVATAWVRRWRSAAILAVLPVAIVLLGAFGPLSIDPVYRFSGATYASKPPLATGLPTIDGNAGVTSQALGVRAARDVLAGRWPLWNHEEGLGTPLLGEMQSAALFPPTWLLVLPQGQIVEQALLQWIAGVGAHLFFRRFGVGRRAALAGGLVFEANGVFAWLRNAVFNPVAFLPWLFLAVEILLLRAMAGDPLRRRLPAVALAAVAASLALYAGFPEEVYLYGLLLVAWVLFRMVGLSRPQAVSFVASLALAGILAALLSAPVLVAFADALGDAELGIHAGGGFRDLFIDPAAMAQLLSPYVFGAIFGTADPYVIDLWGGTGGYCGLVPVVLAVAGLGTARRRGTKLFLVAWIAVAIGATYGLPVFHPAFMALPLAPETAVFRYITVSWLFCLVFLAVLFLDDASQMPRRATARPLAVATAVSAGMLAAALAAAWPLIRPTLEAPSHHRASAAALIALVAILALCWRGAAARAPLRGLSGLMVVEAMAWFLVPYLSHPRHAELDLGLVAFLRSHAGYQRVVAAGRDTLAPNYGSYWGFPLLNYDDLPTPRMAADYVRAHLDPSAEGFGFYPEASAMPTERLAIRRRFHARLPAYAEAGVRFVLATDDFASLALYALDEGRGAADRLLPGQGIVVRGTGAPGLSVAVSGLSLRLGDIDPGAGGDLAATVCSAANCASGRMDVGSAPARGRLTIPLDHALRFAEGSEFTASIARRGGSGAVVVPLQPLAADETPVAVSGEGSRVPDGMAPDLGLIDDDVSLAYTGRTIQVYALRDTRPYASADGCSLDMVSRDLIEASCARPARLTRLELAMPGWAATVDGRPADLTLVDDAFQAVDLPGGPSRVEFRFRPRLFGPAVAGAAVALLALAGIAAAWVTGRRRRVASPGSASRSPAA